MTKDGAALLQGDLSKVHIHFTGIKGTGMAALTEICSYRGARITGSDTAERFYTDEVLERLHIQPTLFSEENITQDIDLLVYSSAYKPDENPELIAARKVGIPLLLYTEALGALSACSYACGIAGVHGKTTTTGITGTIIKELNLPAQVLAGSIISAFGSCTLNLGTRFFVAETCEYQRHFMSFCPQTIVLTSVESDHQDYYPTYESILDAFVDYCCLLPKGGKLIYCADDKGAVQTVQAVQKKRSDIVFIPYGIKAVGDYRVVFTGIREGKQYFKLDGFTGDFYVRIPGRHVVLDSAAACALAVSLYRQMHGECTNDFLYAYIQKALASFAGSKRRSEIIGKIKTAENTDVLIMDDYAHHPTALKTTLAGLREFYPDRYIIADFMSHTYTRTAALFDDFAFSFSDADEVILHKIYASAREHYEGGINGKSLYKAVCKHHPNVHYFEEIDDAVPYVQKRIRHINKDVLLVTLGAGDNWRLSSKIFALNAADKESKSEKTDKADTADTKEALQ